MTVAAHPTVAAPATWSRLKAQWAPAATVAGVAAGCAVIALADPTDPGNVLPPCPTKAIFGVTCPGCGTLRMVYSLLHRDVGAAVYYNALSLAVLPLLVMAWVGWVIGKWRGYPVRTALSWRWAPIVFGVVYLAWFVLRNIPIEPFTSLRV